MIEATEESEETIEEWIEQRREFIRMVEAMTPEARDLFEKLLRGVAEGTMTIEEAQGEAQKFIEAH